VFLRCLFLFLFLFLKQYVGVASALKDGMLLGGNLPDSLSQYLYHGHDDEDDEYEYEDDGHDDDDDDSTGSDTKKVEESDAEKSIPKS
jgi:hypothetical protein